jgi:hypothetical protein
MASSLNAATSGGGGVIVTSDASGDLNIQSGGTTVAAVTSAGVAVTGTLSASGNLTGAVGAASSWLISNNTSDAADSSRLVVNGGGATGSDRGGRAVFYGNEYAGNNGAVEITSGAVAGSTLILQGSNATSHVKQVIESTTVTDVTSTGLAVTGLVDISAATSGQIKFPATQNASANANTLDDYEEGTWTPTINFSGGAGTLSYSARVGTYTKIGNTLFFNMRLVVNKGTAAGTLDNITGLPFSATTYSAGGGVYIDNCSVLSGGCQYVIPSGAVLYVYMSATGTAAAINASSMSTASVLTVSGFYVI